MIRSPIAKTILLIFGVNIGVVACTLTPCTIGKQPQGTSDTVDKNQANRDLHQVGERLAKAIIDRDIQTVLSYDRPDLRHNDEIALKNSKSDLYCYLFDTTCISSNNGKWRSVYDKLSQARQLGIKVNLARSPYDHKLYGSLLFYDQSSISATNLKSSAFLCKEQGVQFVSWKFKLEDGKWKAVTPLFDNETEGLCSE